jgi:alcohol dehydrogenase (cytochrome c)
MRRRIFIFLAVAGVTILSLPSAPAAPRDLVQEFRAHPVTDEMLENPDPADWLLYSRTYDAQRFSPLDQIDRGNVARITRAWTKPLPPGPLEVIPLVYRGVMYLTTPGGRHGPSGVWALDAVTGELIWKYEPGGTAASRVKALAIYGDLLYWTAPAAAGEPQPVIALDAATGAVRWQTPASTETHTAGAIVVEGKVISGRTCNGTRDQCFIAAHDARTGKEPTPS